MRSSPGTQLIFSRDYYSWNARYVAYRKAPGILSTWHGAYRACRLGRRTLHKAWRDDNFSPEVGEYNVSSFGYRDGRTSIKRYSTKVIPCENKAVRRGVAFPADRSARSTPPTLFRYSCGTSRTETERSYVYQPPLRGTTSRWKNYRRLPVCRDCGKSLQRCPGQARVRSAWLESSSFFLLSADRSSVETVAKINCFRAAQSLGTWQEPTSLRQYTPEIVNASTSYISPRVFSPRSARNWASAAAAKLTIVGHMIYETPYKGLNLHL